MNIQSKNSPCTAVTKVKPALLDVSGNPVTRVGDTILSNAFPTTGTVVVIESHSDPVTFIAAVPRIRVMEILVDILESRRAWSSMVMKHFLISMPTCPMPKNALDVDLPIVKVNIGTGKVVWTTDLWLTYEGRELISDPNAEHKWKYFVGCKEQDIYNEQQAKDEADAKAADKAAADRADKNVREIQDKNAQLEMEAAVKAVEDAEADALANRIRTAANGFRNAKLK